MRLFRTLYQKLKRAAPLSSKAEAELAYWTERRRLEGSLDHSHYAACYTELFGLTEKDYEGARVLDVGCGPRGSLEWATMAAERVGLDPLADAYQRLGADAHQMTYRNARAEKIPYPDGAFDVVCIFNSLGHVDDLSSATSELIRVLAPGGLLLLLTDLNHPPSVAEPIAFSWDVVDRFQPGLTRVSERHLEAPEPNLYRSVMAGVPFDHAAGSDRYGILVAKFEKPQIEGR